MKTDFFENISLESIVQYIEGKANQNVIEEVEVWLHSEPSRQKTFETFREVWINLSDKDKLDGTAIENDWNKVFNRINKPSLPLVGNQKHGSNEWVLKSWMRAASILIFIISIVGAYWAGSTNGRLFGIKAPQAKFNEIIVPLGQKSQLVLADGTKVWLNAGSKLKFADRFEGKTREVWLDGEAYFEVSKNPNKPFYVRTSDLNIKVHGTSFNVKAYNSEGTIETTLVEGLVSIANTKGGKGTEVFLEPNHKAVFIKNERSKVAEEVIRNVSQPLKPQTIIVSDPIKVEPLVSWKEGKMVFENETFEDIALKLQRRYDVTINIESEETRLCRFTGSFKNVSIEQAIRALQLTTKFDYMIKDNEITIFKSSHKK